MTSPKAETPAAEQRFKPIPLENLTPEQRALADAIRSGPRGGVKNSAAAKPGPLGGPFNVWLRSPGIGNLIQSLGAEIRFRSTLPPKLNELAIMVTARQWTSQYEWFAHHRLALEAGLDPAIGADIAQGRRPAKMSEDEAIVHDFSRELHETQGVSDATYKTSAGPVRRARRHGPHRGERLLRAGVDVPERGPHPAAGRREPAAAAAALIGTDSSHSAVMLLRRMTSAHIRGSCFRLAVKPNRADRLLHQTRFDGFGSAAPVLPPASRPRPSKPSSAML